MTLTMDRLTLMPIVARPLQSEDVAVPVFLRLPHRSHCNVPTLQPTSNQERIVYRTADGWLVVGYA